MKKTILLLVLFLSLGQYSYSQNGERLEKTGLYMGINFGTWFPDGQNKVLGNPLIFGPYADFMGEDRGFGLSFDLIGIPKVKTTEPIYIKYGDSLLVRNGYFGAELMLNFYQEILETKRFVFRGICGLGYGELSYYNPDQYTNINKKSMVLSPGVDIRYFLFKRVFVRTQLQYSIANYKLRDNISTSFKGNYLTVRFSVGGLTS